MSVNIPPSAAEQRGLQSFGVGAVPAAGRRAEVMMAGLEMPPKGF